jgi:hypothetical protein
VPQLVVVSVAGVHVALGGPGDGDRGRWLIATGGTEDLRQLVHAALDGRGEPTAGLQRGQTHTVRIELSQSRGRAWVYLDDKLLGHKDAPRPEGEPGSASIVIRSIEPVKLLEARVQTRLR